MPADIGSQKITILYHTAANSGEVNLRHLGIRQLGIYEGGYLSIVDTSNAQISPLVCEISGGTHQVRGETTIAVNIAVAAGTPYIVLRWVYAGATSDYMEILAVATPTANDLIVGECTFTGGGDLQGFDYSERSTPNTQDLFLKVEAPDSTMADKMKVRVRAGRIQTDSEVIDINDQQTPSAFTHSGGGATEYGLVYIDASGAVQVVNASGNVSIPEFGGKMVLAIVAIISTTATITQSMITDARNWITIPTSLRAYIKLSDIKNSGVNGGTFTSGAWRTRTLNTEDSDTGNNCALAANQITLAAGTYECRISCPAQLVGNHQTRLQNITDVVTELLGTSEYTQVINAEYSVQTRSFVVGRFTLATSKVLEVQHRCDNTRNNDGFGNSNSFGNEVYTIAEFWKVL